MKSFAISFLFLLYVNNIAAMKTALFPGDPVQHEVILTKLDGTVIKGTLISYTPDKITVLPGSRKEIKRGNMFFPEQIAWWEIRSIRVKQSTLPILLLSGALLVAFYLLLKGRWNPSDYEGVGLVILSPLLFIAALVGIFRKKKFILNGNKEQYLYFLSRLKKFW